MRTPTLKLELWSDYTVDSPLHHEGLVDLTVIGFDTNKTDPIRVYTNPLKGYITPHDFCADVYIPEKYQGCVVKTKFVPRGVVMSTKELFDSDHCHFCDSILDHHHHVSYLPERVLPVCQSCHSRLHKDTGFHPDLTPDSERPGNYNSTFKRLWKKYRYVVGDVEYFHADNGFDHPNPTLAGEREKSIFRSMGLIGGESDV